MPLVKETVWLGFIGNSTFNQSWVSRGLPSESGEMTSRSTDSINASCCGSCELRSTIIFDVDSLRSHFLVQEGWNADYRIRLDYDKRKGEMRTITGKGCDDFPSILTSMPKHAQACPSMPKYPDKQYLWTSCWWYQGSFQKNGGIKCLEHCFTPYCGSAVDGATRMVRQDKKKYFTLK